MATLTDNVRCRWYAREIVRRANRNQLVDIVTHLLYHHDSAGPSVSAQAVAGAMGWYKLPLPPARVCKADVVGQLEEFAGARGLPRHGFPFRSGDILSYSEGLETTASRPAVFAALVSGPTEDGQILVRHPDGEKVWISAAAVTSVLLQIDDARIIPDSAIMEAAP